VGILRIILAVAVIIGHSDSVLGIRFTGGIVAVEVFFIISGFYMAMILDKKYIGEGSYILFLSNRFLRLYPMFWIVLCLTILSSVISYAFFQKWLMLSPYIKYFDIMTIPTLLFQIITNITLFGQDIVMFLGMHQETGGMYFTYDFSTSDPMFWEFLFIPQAWSLGIEVMFYLIAPFIVRKSNHFIMLLIILSFSIRLFTYFYLGYINDPWTYRFFPSELVFFLLGTVSYRLYKAKKILEINFMGGRLKHFIVISFFLFLLFYQFIYNVRFGHIINWLFYGFCCISLPFIFELSKPGGRASFAEPNMLNPQVFVERKLRQFFQYISPDETAFIRWQFSRELQKADFQNINIIPFDWLHPSVPKQLIDLVSQTGSVIERVPFLREFSGSLHITAVRNIN
jgi:peptidoglycan/LPS O-acetylase OafA/YrhL